MGLKIKKVLKDRGMSVQDLAAKMGITRIALSYQINGNPTLETLNKIAEHIGVDISELFECRPVSGNPTLEILVKIAEHIGVDAGESVEYRCPKCGCTVELKEK
ncbi:MAG: helix-turn-helix transcriptional regulator [Prevotella sp.]|jgi:transcriptional regulator with XRE-family HTH domain|nr:helix-turn-helix transcriptional regulator [Prevotella sp.]